MELCTELGKKLGTAGKILADALSASNVAVPRAEVDGCDEFKDAGFWAAEVVTDLTDDGTDVLTQPVPAGKELFDTTWFVFTGVKRGLFLVGVLSISIMHLTSRLHQASKYLNHKIQIFARNCDIRLFALNGK